SAGVTVCRSSARFWLYAEKAIVFGEPFRARQRSVLEEIALPANGKVGCPVVFGFAATYTDGHLPAGGARQLQGVQGAGQRADLVHLEKQRIAGAAFDGAGDARGIGAKQVVAESDGAGG